MSQTGPDSECERSVTGLCCEWYLFPSSSWHLLNLRLVPMSYIPDHRYSHLLIGSDGTINYWDKDARTRLKSTFFSGSSLFFVMSDWIILQQLLSLAPGLFPQRASTVTAPSSRTPYRTTGPRDTPACHQVIPTNWCCTRAKTMRLRGSPQSGKSTFLGSWYQGRGGSWEVALISLWVLLVLSMPRYKVFVVFAPMLWSVSLLFTCLKWNPSHYSTTCINPGWGLSLNHWPVCFYLVIWFPWWCESEG